MAKNRNNCDFSGLLQNTNDLVRKLLFFTLLFIVHDTVFAQGYRNQELSITTENDVYLLTNKDRYYSNGLLINYRIAPEVGSFFRKRGNDSTKFIASFDIAHKFYTPVGLELTDPETFDRPYAGLLTTGITFSNFPTKNEMFSYGLEAGVIGKASGGEAFQKWYHQFAGFPTPRGWDYQIKNELIVALKLEYNKQLPLVSKTMDMVTYSRLKLGTAFLNTNHGVDIRLGKLNPINYSAFKNSLIGAGSTNAKVHSYFYFGYGLEYVAHNTLIQGSIWNIESPHTEEIKNLVRHWRMGFATSSKSTTFKMTYYHLSEEVVGAEKHAYIAFELKLMFIKK